ncbi:tetratricopeptide repeat protein [Pyxidicoccus fallax]|uniref:Tetratricopeptide repeat protein n=1 Tax=Pyxidicoccus fallax TaxID=394095 RepID=A0A848LID6_9BACT|nr:tetratricopeptide repeat protein [Pyxidicoccus fallax]NMO17479.1 tetratricopeptide repeat protein [Pyxidicoccus fallax]NPC80762.1 tetratricopeptide repeat protein [Pyxidicoccus fallax]
MQSLRQLLAEGRLQEALTAATRRLVQQPDDEEALLVSARIALAEGRPDQAEQLLSRVRSPKSRQEVVMMRATAALLREDFAGARNLYLSVTQQPPVPAEAWHGLGLALLALRQVPEARAAHEKAVALKPEMAAFRLELGHALDLEQRDRAAVHQFVRALRLDPRDSRGYWVLAQLLERRGKARSARRILELGLRLLPESRLLRATLDASQPLTGAGPEDPVSALLREASELMERKRNRDALKLLRAGWDKGLRSVELKLLEAEACRALLPPDMPAAVRAYEEAISLAPEDWKPLTHLGICLLSEGQRHLPRATEALETARRLAPELPETALNLILAYVKGNRLPEARELGRQVEEALPPDHPLRVQAGSLLEDLRQV